MKRSRFSEEQIIGILKEAEGEPVKTVCARAEAKEMGAFAEEGLSFEDARESVRDVGHT
jgi:hypothetical protein